MNTYDVRKGDIVRFRPGLSKEDKAAIVKFASRVSKQAVMQEYAAKIIDGRHRFKVNHWNATKKVPTEYGMIMTSENILVPVQSRFLVVIERKPRHPLTSVFSDFDA